MMKKIVFISLLLCVGLMASAQSKWVGFKGFFQPTTTENLKTLTGEKSLTDGVLQIRFDVGVQAVAFYPMSTVEPKARPFEKVAGGLFFTHVRETGIADWAAGALITLPNPVSGFDKYGVGIAGAYNVFKVGVGYDFGTSFKEGFSIWTGLQIDLFNAIQ